MAQGGGYRFIRASDRKEQSRLILGARVLNDEGDCLTAACNLMFCVADLPFAQAIPIGACAASCSPGLVPTKVRRESAFSI